MPAAPQYVPVASPAPQLSYAVPAQAPVRAVPVYATAQLAAVPAAAPVATNTRTTVSQRDRVALGIDFFRLPIPFPRFFTVQGPQRVVSETEYAPAAQTVPLPAVSSLQAQASYVMPAAPAVQVAQVAYAQAPAPMVAPAYVPRTQPTQVQYVPGAAACTPGAIRPSAPTAAAADASGRRARGAPPPAPAPGHQGDRRRTEPAVPGHQQAARAAATRAGGSPAAAHLPESSPGPPRRRRLPILTRSRPFDPSALASG